LDERDARLCGKRRRLFADNPELQPDRTRAGCDRLPRHLGAVFRATKDINEVNAFSAWK
jgi:hypothetical protein